MHYRYMYIYIYNIYICNIYNIYTIFLSLMIVSFFTKACSFMTGVLLHLEYVNAID